MILTGYSYIYLDSAFTTVHKQNQFLKDEKTDLDLLIELPPSARPRQLAPEVAKLRRIKSKAEIKLMRKAADISAIAHAKVQATPLSPARWTYWETL